MIRNVRASLAGACSTGFLAAALMAALVPALEARADVTIVEETTLNAAIVKMHLNSTERTTRDKQRRDSDGKMDGMLSMLAGSMKSGDIIRLDRDLEWRLEPDKKKYQETLFPTPEQRALAQQQMQETLDKMKQCPVGPGQTRPADSGCEKTEPKFNVSKTDESAVIAGHPTKKTLLTMTYSCKDAKTGDTCDFIATSELWLSQDTVEGFDERRAFQMEHVKKLGLDEVAGSMKAQVQMAVAPYMDQLKQLSSQAGDLKGTPLRTLFSISVGGPQCAQARNANPGGTGSAAGGTVADAGTAAGQAAEQSATSSTTSAATSTAESRAGQAEGNGIAGQVLGNAAGAFTSKLLGGLMAKKPDSKPATPAAAPAGAANSVTLMSMQMEIKSVSTAPIEPGAFDLPPGWQKIEPKPGKSTEFECPKTTGS